MLLSLSGYPRFGVGCYSFVRSEGAHYSESGTLWYAKLIAQPSRVGGVGQNVRSLHSVRLAGSWFRSSKLVRINVKQTTVIADFSRCLFK